MVLYGSLQAGIGGQVIVVAGLAAVGRVVAMALQSFIDFVVQGATSLIECIAAVLNPQRHDSPEEDQNQSAAKTRPPDSKPVTRQKSKGEVVKEKPKKFPEGKGEKETGDKAEKEKATDTSDSSEDKSEKPEKVEVQLRKAPPPKPTIQQQKGPLPKPIKRKAKQTTKQNGKDEVKKDESKPKSKKGDLKKPSNQKDQKGAKDAKEKVDKAAKSKKGKTVKEKPKKDVSKEKPKSGKSKATELKLKIPAAKKRAETDDDDEDEASAGAAPAPPVARKPTKARTTKSSEQKDTVEKSKSKSKSKSKGKPSAELTKAKKPEVVQVKKETPTSKTPKTPQSKSKGLKSVTPSPTAAKPLLISKSITAQKQNSTPKSKPALAPVAKSKQGSKPKSEYSVPEKSKETRSEARKDKALVPSRPPAIIHPVHLVPVPMPDEPSSSEPDDFSMRDEEETKTCIEPDAAKPDNKQAPDLVSISESASMRGDPGELQDDPAKNKLPRRPVKFCDDQNVMCNVPKDQTKPLPQRKGRSMDDPMRRYIVLLEIYKRGGYVLDEDENAQSQMKYIDPGTQPPPPPPPPPPNSDQEQQL